MAETRSVAPWSDLNHDVLFIVMMQLGVVDFLVFSIVCKSWRSLALSNRNMFIVSRSPMTISISTDANEKECYLQDIEGSKLKTILPHFADRTCIGVTCGYLILYGEKTRDFWLVNPITRHKLHFPSPECPLLLWFLGAILVFSPSIAAWVLIVFSRYYSRKIWFSIAGKREWTYVSTPFRICDVHAFKGKIYTIHSINRLCEVSFFPTPKVTLLEIKNFPNPELNLPVFASSDENLYVMELSSKHTYTKIHEINFSKMEWLPRGKTGEEYAFFISNHKLSVDVIRVESWADFHSKYKGYCLPDKSGKGRLFYAKMWYFFYDCFNVNFQHE